jgi:hypothetical protein
MVGSVFFTASELVKIGMLKDRTVGFATPCPHLRNMITRGFHR